MENVKESIQERKNNDQIEICEKPQEQAKQQQQEQQGEEDKQLQANPQPPAAAVEIQESEQQKQTVVEEQKQLEVTDDIKATPQSPPLHEQQPQQQQETPAIEYEEEEEDDDDDDDDDEEKETSQKLVIDIPDEEEEDEKEDEEEDDDEVIALDDFAPEEPAAKVTEEKISPKPEVAEAIITLSDGEEDMPANEAVTKPGKVQKRRSMGAASTTNDEEHFRLKRRKINVAGAPKMPLTGYVRYMNDRRESLRKEHPSKTAMEHTKMIGEEWHSLPSDVKASYLKAADEDKQRYVKELHSFLKSRPDILASELAKNKIRKTSTETNSPNPAGTAASTSAAAAAASVVAAATKPLAKEKTQTNETVETKKENTKDIITKVVTKASTSQQANANVKTANENKRRKRTPTPPTSNSTSTHTTNASTSAAATAAAPSSSSINIVTPTPGEIPIFTNEFLEHNKIYDMELRSLRKSKTDLEQQNSVLEKHVENMKFGVEKMITENNELEEKNRLLEIYLDKLKKKLALALSTLPLPTAPNGATVENIDKYMQDLYKMSTSNSHGPATLNKAKDIIRKLDLQIQL